MEKSDTNKYDVMDIRFKFKTTNGQEIPVYEGIPVSDIHIDAINKRLRRLYGPENERRKADYRYNCHGLTLINKLGWIGPIIPKKSHFIISGNAQNSSAQENENDQIIEDILHGNGFRVKYEFSNRDIAVLKGDEDIKEGDIAVYKAMIQKIKKIQHTALIVGFFKVNNKICDIKVLSKMRYGAEYFHKFRKVPDELGKIIEIWTDRETQQCE